MLEFILTGTNPDGTFPIIGDCDNGRLHRLKVWENEDQEWNDFRYLLAAGAILFQRTDFAQVSGDQLDEAVWFFGKKALTFSEVQGNIGYLPIQLPSKIYPEGGLCILRHKDLQIVIDAGRNGQNGNGGHAHNDLLSFELFADNHPWIIDPGTFVYTADYDARQRFRSTAFHNVLQVDGAEQIPQIASQPFYLPTDPAVRVIEWLPGASFDRFTAEHDAYLRLPIPAIHRREFVLDKPGRVLVIHDSLISTSPHILRSWLHFHPQITLEPSKANAVRVRWKGLSEVDCQVKWKADGVSELETGQSSLSTSYGKYQVAPYLTLNTQGTWIEMIITFT